MEFWFVKNVPKYLNCSCFSKNLFLRFSCNFVLPNLKNQNVVLIGVRPAPISEGSAILLRSVW